METYGGVGCIDHVFLTSVLVGGEWSIARPGRFTPGERTPGTHWIARVGPRASLDSVEKRNFMTLPGLELYRLRYPGYSRMEGSCEYIE
jgi:hypothetical protein